MAVLRRSATTHKPAGKRRVAPLWRLLAAMVILLMACLLSLDGCGTPSQDTTTSASASHTYGTPYYSSGVREWPLADQMPDNIRAEASNDLSSQGAALLVPKTRGPLPSDQRLMARASAYHMTVSGERGAYLQVIAPNSNQFVLETHVSNVALPDGGGSHPVTVRGFGGASWHVPPGDGYPFPQTVFSWSEKELHLYVFVNETLIDPDLVLAWLDQWQWLP